MPKQLLMKHTLKFVCESQITGRSKVCNLTPLFSTENNFISQNLLPLIEKISQKDNFSKVIDIKYSHNVLPMGYQ